MSESPEIEYARRMLLAAECDVIRWQNRLRYLIQLEANREKISGRDLPESKSAHAR